MKTLILAEKESQALDLVKGLEIYGKFKDYKAKRYYESDKYIITWAQGHIIGLKEPRDYENWGNRKWELEALPWYPPNFRFEHKVINPKAYKQLKEIFQRKDIQEVVIATDAGREGTLIGQELIDHFKFRGPVKRYYDSSVMTPENIRRIMATDLKGLDFHVPRVKAAYARAYADLLLGMNFTIGFSAKANEFLNIGRVKTPVLAILAERRREIENFKEETYYELEANFGNVYKGIWFKDELNNTRFFDKNEAERIVQKVKGKMGTIIKKEVKKVPEYPKMLYNLNTLQREANKKFGYDPEKTLEIVQSLYDAHKILSYPRTESEVIGSAHVKELPSILNVLQNTAYGNIVNEITEKRYEIYKKVVNDKKLSDHHAIIPTNVKPNFQKLSKDERRIYDMVVKRFLATFYPPAVYEKTEVVTEAENETFKTTGKVILDKGWKVIYSDMEEDEEENNSEIQTIPKIEEGEKREIIEIIEMEKKTKPPKLYDFDKLLAVMENPKKLLKTEELRKSLESAENNAGLGTPATRATILKELLERKYIVKKGKSLDITDLGLKLVDIAPEKLKSPEITAEWEGKLRKMELNQYDFRTFMLELKTYIETVLDELRHSDLSVSFDKNDRAEKREIAKCPHCHTSIRNLGKFYACESNTRENPCFFVASVIGKRTITEPLIKELAQNGITRTIKGLVANSGKKFDAKLKLDGKKVVFSFEKGEIAKCPYCGTSITERSKVYACESNTVQNPCFVVFKEIAKKKITKDLARQLAEKGETGIVKGFEGKKGKFDAKLKLENRKVVFSFDYRK